MPNVGKPSGACQQCKKSHVKCDEARPACGRCLRTNKICTGYADGLDLVLRDQTETVKAQVKRRQQPLTQSQSSISEQRAVFRSPIPNITISLAESEESHAVAFFMFTFALYPRDTQSDREFLELLPLLSGNLRVGSPLSLALTASARFTYSRWELRRKDVENHAISDYGHALEATRRALQDPVESLSDGTLMAVCLLGFYEAATSAFAGKVSPSRHFDGAAALIKRRRNGHMTDLSKRLLVAIRSKIIFRAVQFSSPIDRSSDFLNDDEEMPLTPGALLDLMAVDAANLLAVAHQILVSNTELNSDRVKLTTATSNLLLRAQAVDAKLATWPELVPRDYFAVHLNVDNIPKSIIDAGFYGNGCDIYPDIRSCGTWNEWRVARLMVLGIIARIDQKEPSDQATATIQELVDGICASVPFSLGDRTQPGRLDELQIVYPSLPGKPMSKVQRKTAGAYGGWGLFATLKKAIELGMHLRSGQHEWLSGQLMRLAKMYNVYREVYPA